MPKSDKPALIFAEPMESLLVSKLPAGPGWAYEIKLDGYRARVLCDGKATKMTLSFFRASVLRAANQPSRTYSGIYVPRDN
jgi:hypothetical protein